MAGKTYVYAGTEAGIFYRKESGEDHWHELDGNGLPPEPEVRAIVVHPQEPAKVYIGTQRGPVSQQRPWRPLEAVRYAGGACRVVHRVSAG